MMKLSVTKCGVLSLTNAPIVIQEECSSLNKEMCFRAKAFEEKACSLSLCNECSPAVIRPASHRAHHPWFTTADLFCFSQTQLHIMFILF